MRDQDVLLWLCSTPGIGSVTIQKLQSFYGSFAAIWEAEIADMMRGAGIGKKAAEALGKERAFFDPFRSRQEFEPQGIRFVTWLCPEYPDVFREMYDPPYGLFLLGQFPATGEAALSVVGSRTPTAYGRVAAEKLVRDCAAQGLTIVSGMARGIDTVAHRTALEAGGQTIAVLGSGFWNVYPPENRPLVEQIAHGHGAVLSEWHPKTPGKPQNFPVRNRLIAALARATLVVEAGVKSGSLITVDQALEQGRDVYAVPGPITSPQSDGTNRLIQQGAKLVHTVQDILEDYEEGLASVAMVIPTHASPHTPHTPQGNSSPNKEAERLLEAIGSWEVHVDELLLRTGWDAGTLHMWLLRLQVQGKIAALPGGQYIRLHP